MPRKKCQLCEKTGELKPVLTVGPRGYRRYEACPDCQRKAAEKLKATKKKPQAVKS